MNGFWTIQQVLAFIITFTAVAGIAWRIVRGLIRQSAETHAKVDAIEALLDQVKQKGMTAGAEEALHRLERRLLLTQAQVRVVMEVDGTGYVETNKEGGLTYCNTQFIHWTGMSLEEAKGYGWASSIHPADRARVVEDWESSVREQRPVDLWFRYKRGSTETPVHARSVVVRDDHNGEEVIGFVALIVPVDSKGS